VKEAKKGWKIGFRKERKIVECWKVWGNGIDGCDIFGLVGEGEGFLREGQLNEISDEE
jgi:hypothetical protein